jgi:hypothetical protein
MRYLVVLFMHFIATLARLLGPRGVRSLVAESLLLKHQLLRGRSTIDGGESELLSSRLKELVADGVRKLLVNLVNLTQVDSSGVGVIVAAYVNFVESGCYGEEQNRCN